MNSENYIIVKESFNISGRGVGIIPYKSLPFSLFKKQYKVFIEMPDGENRDEVASVESILISVSKKQEYFTLVLKCLKASDIPKNTKITIIEEL